MLTSILNIWGMLPVQYFTPFFFVLVSSAKGAGLGTVRVPYFVLLIFTNPAEPLVLVWAEEYDQCGGRFCFITTFLLQNNAWHRNRKRKHYHWHKFLLLQWLAKREIRLSCAARFPLLILGTVQKWLHPDFGGFDHLSLSVNHVSTRAYCTRPLPPSVNQIFAPAARLL